MSGNANVMVIDWPSLFSTVVGGIIAAVTAYVLAQRASRATLARDRASRNEQLQTATHRALVKLLAIVNGIGGIHRQIEASIAPADGLDRPGMRMWQKVRPIVGVSQTEIDFSADDLSAFVAAGNFDFVTSLLELAQRYIALADSLREYSRARRQFTDELAELGPVMDGDHGALQLTEADRARLEPRSVDLESLIGQVRAFADEDYRSGLALAAQFGPNARAALPGIPFPNLGVPNQAVGQPAVAQGNSTRVR